MAGLGLLSEGHLLVLARDHAAQEPLGLLADALAPLAAGHAPGDLLRGVATQSDLPHDALEQVQDVVVQRGGRLDELTVEDHGARAALWERDGERDREDGEDREETERDREGTEGQSVS